MTRLCADLEVTNPYNAILYLWSDPQTPQVSASAAEYDAAARHCTTILHLLQALPADTPVLKRRYPETLHCHSRLPGRGTAGGSDSASHQVRCGDWAA